jgi:hypothetical protein
LLRLILKNDSILAILFGIAFLFIALQIRVNKKNYSFRIFQLAMDIVQVVRVEQG